MTAEEKSLHVGFVQHTQTLGPAWDWRQTPFATPAKILSQFPPTSLSTSAYPCLSHDLKLTK